MTIGSRKGSVRRSIRTPKFLDKSGGFYCRLGDPETLREAEGDGEMRAEEAEEAPTSAVCPAPCPGEDGGGGRMFDANEGATEEDGETLLRGPPGRRGPRGSSSRWRRSARRKQEEERVARPATEEPTAGRRVSVEGTEWSPAPFAVPEDADQQVLIGDERGGREEEEEEEGDEERKQKKEQEEGMKVIKRNTVKTCRKALDRALRRGWAVFIANLYSVTLAPVSSSPPSSKKSPQHNIVLAEFQ